MFPTSPINPFSIKWPCAASMNITGSKQLEMVSDDHPIEDILINQQVISNNKHVNINVVTDNNQMISNQCAMLIGSKGGSSSASPSNNSDKELTYEEMEVEMNSFKKDMFVLYGGKKVHSIKSSYTNEEIEEMESASTHDSEYFTNSPYTEEFSINESDSGSELEELQDDEDVDPDDANVISDNEDNFIYF